jgi:fumarate reductase flavoprotein subunit
MVYEYGSKFVDCVQTAAPGHLGDGLKMAMELGGRTSHIGDAAVGSLAVDVNTGADRATFAAHEGGIYVNVNGKRFTAENAPDGFYGQVSEHFLDQPGKVAWVVYGDNVRDMWIDHFSREDIEKHHEYKADTIEELAKQAGIDPKGLAETVERYNSDIESEGYDTEFGRKHLVFIHGDLRSIPDKGPYYAVKVECCTSSFKGGMKTNTRFQMLNEFDEIIPGLYSAGEINGGLWSRGLYMGGVNFGGYLTFGRVVGMYASQEQSWDK